MPSNDNYIPCDFDIVSPETMDSLQTLRSSSLWQQPLEDSADATPLAEAERLHNSFYMTREGYVFPYVTGVRNDGNPDEDITSNDSDTFDV